jgi:hypothetical protein
MCWRDERRQEQQLESKFGKAFNFQLPRTERARGGEGERGGKKRRGEERRDTGSRKGREEGKR